MTNLRKYLNKPEYLLQPAATVRRIFRSFRAAGGMEVVRLPWGLPLEVNTRESIGRTISHHGLFELSVVEAIFRLTEPTDIFLDVGANIGFMSSAALAAGARRVISFEPHPDLFRQYTRNLSLWTAARPEIADRILPHQQAVSDKIGSAMLKFSRRDFSGNQGVASLEAGDDRDDCNEVEVATTTLTQVFALCGGSVGVLKIDIEGHELAALTASQNLLEAGRVRDILFEDSLGLDSEVSRLLSSFGYSLFGLNKTLLGPVLLDGRASVMRFLSRSDESLNFLATRNPDRVRQRMSERGYKCLSRRLQVTGQPST